MVRHEAAEALGSISPEAYKELLCKYAYDPDPVVRDSCIIALAMFDYSKYL